MERVGAFCKTPAVCAERQEIQALIDTREEEDLEVFINYMVRLHCSHLKQDIDQFVKNVASEMVDKRGLSVSSQFRAME